MNSNKRQNSNHRRQNQIKGEKKRRLNLQRETNTLQIKEQPTLQKKKKPDIHSN